MQYATFKDGEESHDGLLKDFNNEGLGRIQWRPLLEAFRADVLELIPGGNPSLENGYTDCLFAHKEEYQVQARKSEDVHGSAGSNQPSSSLAAVPELAQKIDSLSEGQARQQSVLESLHPQNHPLMTAVTTSDVGKHHRNKLKETASERLANTLAEVDPMELQGHVDASRAALKALVVQKIAAKKAAAQRRMKKRKRKEPQKTEDPKVPELDGEDALQMTIMFLRDTMDFGDEDAVQESVAAVQRAILTGAEHAAIQVHDTSKQGQLRNPSAKIDFTACTGQQVYWPLVVFPTELKADGKNSSQLDHGVGQLVERADIIFQKQPTREKVLGPLVTEDSIELFEVTKPNKNANILEMNVESTGSLDYRLTTASVGFRIHCQLLTSTRKQLGYNEPGYKPDLAGNGIHDMELYDVGEGDCGAWVYRAKLRGAGDDAKTAKDVAVKLVHGKQGEREEKAYNILNEKGVTGIASMKFCIDAPGREGWKAICIEPWGALLDVAHANEFPRLAQELTGIISEVWTHGIIHRDVTLDNIVEDEQGQLYLIDWSTSKERQGTATKDVASPGAKADLLTGTYKYHARDVLLSDSHSLASQFESTFLSLASLVFAGTPWMPIGHLQTPAEYARLRSGFFNELVPKDIPQLKARPRQFFLAWKRIIFDGDIVDKIQAFHEMCNTFNAGRRV